MSAPHTAFAMVLEMKIRDKIIEMQADGVVGMSGRNLLQVVRPPSENLDGAPRGTNAPVYYAQLFREVLADTRIPPDFEIIREKGDAL